MERYSPETLRKSRHRTMKRGTMECGHCKRTFARAEHLMRHERTHRNEKPFKCGHCDSKFTRKDVIRRHHLRYHPNIPVPAPQENAPGPATEAVPVTQLASLTPPPMRSEMHSGGGPLLRNLDHYQFDLFSLALDPELCGESVTDDGTLIVPITTGMDLNFDQTIISNSFDLAQIDVEASSTLFPTSDLPAELGSPSWCKGSLNISTTKRAQIVSEVSRILSKAVVAEPDSLPSQLTLEKLLTGFAEIILKILPFIHIPTWNADSAQPCLLLAVASVGALYHGEKQMGGLLFQSAELLLTEHLFPNSAQNNEHPIWLIQTVLALVVFGMGCGDQDKFGRASSWASFLGNAARAIRTTPVEAATAGQDVTERWTRWIEAETAIRTKYAAFCILNNLTIWFNRPTELLDRDMNGVPLPSTETDWTFSTPLSWDSGRALSPAIRTSFSDVMQNIVSPSEGKVPEMTIFGGYAVLQGLVQSILRFQESMWSSRAMSDLRPSIHHSLNKWRTSWEGNLETMFAQRYPHNVVLLNASALLRFAYMQLHTDFAPVRSALASHNALLVAESMKGLSIPITRSTMCLESAKDAIYALRSRIQLGMTGKRQNRSCCESLLVHRLSFECCLLSSAWVAYISSIPEAEWSSEERHCFRLAEEAIREVEPTPSNSELPYSSRLVSVWATTYEHCATWGLELLLSEALKAYTKALSSGC